MTTEHLAHTSSQDIGKNSLFNILMVVTVRVIERSERSEGHKDFIFVKLEFLIYSSLTWTSP